MFVRSRHFAISEVCPASDSSLAALNRWIKWHSELSYLYHSDSEGTTPPTRRLKEHLDSSRAPDIDLADIIGVMRSNRVPAFLATVLVDECLSRLRSDPGVMALPDATLSEGLFFLAEQSWEGFFDLKVRLIMIGLARLEHQSDSKSSSLAESIRLANPLHTDKPGGFVRLPDPAFKQP